MSWSNSLNSIQIVNIQTMRKERGEEEEEQVLSSLLALNATREWRSMQCGAVKFGSLFARSLPWSLAVAWPCLPSFRINWQKFNHFNLQIITENRETVIRLRGLARAKWWILADFDALLCSIVDHLFVRFLNRRKHSFLCCRRQSWSKQRKLTIIQAAQLESISSQSIDQWRRLDFTRWLPLWRLEAKHLCFCRF